MKIAIGADHAGYELKEKIKQRLAQEGNDVHDKGTNSTESVDYPDFARLVGEEVSRKDADLGVSVIISGLMSDVHECCSVAGVKPHTCETSLGVWGNTGRLPDEDILRFTTMCGHGQVPFNLVNKIVEDVKAGKLTLPEAGQELAKPCQCGVFNPVRAAAMVEEIMCLWGVHVV